MIDEVARATYLNVLAEIKHRLAAVDQVLTGRVPIATKIAEELCILQFRMVSELIAIGCLILHEDLLLSKSGLLAKAWNASQIFKELALLHSDFFPQPLQPDAPDKFKWEHYSGSFMTKEKIIAAYEREFGEALHRGNVRKIFRDDPPLKLDRIAKIQLEFKNLLNRHTVISTDREHICHFNMSPEGESPTGYLFGRLPDGNPSQLIE